MTGYEPAVVKWGLLRGVGRAVSTVGSGQVIFARNDIPDQATYDVAKAVEEHQSVLKWYIRIYTYDKNTVGKTIMFHFILVLNVIIRQEDTFLNN